MKKIVLSVSVCIVSFILGISLGTLTADRAQQDGVSAGDISAADTEISGVLNQTLHLPKPLKQRK